jgi:cysteinyl-tRNA synthetase
MVAFAEPRGLQLHNTLSGRKEVFEPSDPSRVTVYVCGPTVYDFAHIGNARPAVVFDVLARLLRQRYPQVLYARNFTDVDDKINAAAAAAGLPIGAITERYIDAYHADMQALGVLAPDLEPRVTQHIPDIVALIETLIVRGHAYEAEGHVLFEVASFPEYGKLSRRRPQDMLAGARVEVAPYKRDPLDFVLWKPSSAEQPGWDSPWGRGRPGWHIECTAMIGRHLGMGIDIHGGGQDLIFPHHENEIAQGTCAHGQTYCRTWVHNSFVTVDGHKMSKSLGNVLLVRDLLAQAPGEAIRLALLSTHYRHPLDWNAQRLAAARQALQHGYQALARGEEGIPRNEAPAPDPAVLDALNNDLNVPGALVRLRALADTVKHSSSDAERSHAQSVLRASGALLGLWQRAPEQALAELAAPSGASDIDAAWVEALIAERQDARQRRDYANADRVRAELAQAGVAIEDGPEGTTWRHQAEVVQ